jgi:hypothetical protein
MIIFILSGKLYLSKGNLKGNLKRNPMRNPRMPFGRHKENHRKRKGRDVKRCLCGMKKRI